MTRDAGALLKLADELEWLALASNKDFALHNGRGKMTKASIALRQAASQGSAGGEQSEVLSESAGDTDEYQPRSAFRLVELLRSFGYGPRSWQSEAADMIERLTFAPAQSPDQIEITRLSGLLAEAQKIIAEYKASTIAGARDGLAQAQQVGDFYLVPREIIDQFPEININNYDHDDACALNAWGCEVVTNTNPAGSPDVRSAVVDQIANIVSDYYDEDEAGRFRKCAQHIAGSIQGAAQAARDAVIEECAKVAACHASGWPLTPNGLARQDTAEEIYKDILALSSVPSASREYDPNVAPCDDAEFGMKP